MTELTLSLNTVSCDNTSLHSKKQVLEHVAHLASEQHEDLNYVEVLQALLQRERIGSTAVGHGVAIPHARIAGLITPFCCLVTLETPIDFDTDESTGVDIIFGLLVPENADDTHLQILSHLARRLENAPYRQALRQAKTDENLLAVATT